MAKRTTVGQRIKDRVDDLNSGRKNPTLLEVAIAFFPFFLFFGLVLLILPISNPISNGDGDSGEDVEGYFVGDVESVEDDEGYEIEDEYIIDGRLYEISDNGTVEYEDGEEERPKTITVIALITLIIIVAISLFLIIKGQFDDIMKK